MQTRSSIKKIVAEFTSHVVKPLTSARAKRAVPVVRPLAVVVPLEAEIVVEAEALVKDESQELVRLERQVESEDILVGPD